MTDKNFVHGSVQRSEQESNPITCDLVSHTPKNWYHTQGAYGTVIAIYLLVDTSKISLRLKLQVLIFPEPYVLVLLST